MDPSYLVYKFSSLFLIKIGVLVKTHENKSQKNHATFKVDIDFPHI